MSNIVKISELTDKEKEKWKKHVQETLPTARNVKDSSAVELQTSDIPIISKADPRLRMARKRLTEYTAEDYNTASKLASINQRKYSNIINNMADKNPVGAFLLNAEMNLANGMNQSVMGINNAINTIGASATKGIENIAKFTNNTDLENRARDTYNKRIAEGNYLDIASKFISGGNQGINNGVIRTGGNVASTIGNQLMSAGLGGSTGLSGSTTQAIGVAGSSAQEVLNENKDNIVQALITGGTKGYLSKKIEDVFDANILTSGSKKTSIQKQVNNWIANSFKSNTGKLIAQNVSGVLGENAEEFLEDNLGNIIDKFVNNKDLPSFEEWWNNTTETAKTTTLTTIVMQLLGFGGGDIDTEVDSDVDFWTKEAQKIVNDKSIQNNTQNIQQNQVNNQRNLSEQQITQIKNNVAQNQNMEQINRLPIANDENTYSNKMKGTAIQEINNSNVSTSEKAQMLEALNKINDVTDADMEAIRQVIRNSENIETNSKLPVENYKYDSSRRKKYMEYKNDTNTYDATEVNNVLDTVPTNKNGRRTVKQWLKTADEIGKRIANKSDAEIERIAYKSWFDIEPNKSITQYDSESKKQVGFQKFTSDEWINTINNAVNKVRSDNNSINKKTVNNNIANNLETLYNNAKIGETTTIPIEDVLSMERNGGGYRTEQQVSDLKNDIVKNGITTPIEIYKKNDGTFSIENGNHRLKIAQELGIKNIPIKIVESWQNIGVSTKDTSKDFVQEYGGVYDDRITEKNSDIDEGRWNRERSRSGSDNQFGDSRRTRGNAEIYATKSYSNEQTSSVENKGNNRKQEVDVSTSFNLSKDNKESKHNTISELATGDYTKRQRKHYDSIMKSQYTSDEAKAISKQLMKSDTYVPESNNKQLKTADERIRISGPDSELNSLTARAMTGGNIKSDDIAVGERLIQYYSKTGDKQKLQEAIQATAMAGTTAGQTVQAMSLLNHQTPEGQAIWLQRSVEKMNNDLRKSRGENAEQFKLTEDMIEKIVNSKDEKDLHNNLNKVYEELGQQVSKTTIQKIDAWRYFAMLANPRTHIRNIVGNVAMAGTQSVKNKIAGTIEGIVSKVNPEMERTHTIIPASEEVKKFAKSDIENVADRLGLNENKYNPKSRLENSMRTFKSDTIENTVGKAFKFNDNLLEAEDGVGLKYGYTKALSEYMTANNLNPKTITDKQLAKARNYAVEQAKEATFHQESSLATLLNQFSNKNNISKFFMDSTLPFKKTPINVAKAGLEYSPVGLVKSAVYDTVKLRNGDITVNQYIDNVSKGLTGTGIALVGYALASAGILKASGSDDKDKEGYDEDRGNQTYSIKIGDNTYSLDWLAPTGIPLFIGAEVHEIMQASREEKTSSSDDDTKYSQAIKTATNILDAFTNAMNPMTEMSMLSGLTSSLKSYDGDSSKMLANMGTNAVKSYVNQFVPTALSQVAKTTDTYERSTTSTKIGTLPKAVDSTKNYIMSKIPGLRQLLPTKTDVWGNDIKQADNVLQRALENGVFPWTRKEVSTNAVDSEIIKLYDNTGESSVFPDTINKNLTIDKQKYLMTSDEYSKYKKQYGKDSYELLDNLVKSSNYKKMNDTQKKTAIEKVYSYTNEQIKVDYAKQNKLDYDESTLSVTVNQIKKNNGNISNYFEYLALTNDLNKNTEKMKALYRAKYDDNTKKEIYKNSVGKEDSIYSLIEKTNINITEYIGYKSQEFTSDKEDNGTITGSSISGSKKKKVYNYIENMNITYSQKLLLKGMQYSLTDSEKSKVDNYVRKLNISNSEKLNILGKIKGFTIYKDNTYEY